MTKSMRRWEISAIGRENLRVAHVAVPTLGPRELLIRASAVSLNNWDKLFLDSGGYAAFQLPFTPGSEVTGVVEAVGAEARRFSVGDRILSSFTAGWPAAAARRGHAAFPWRKSAWRSRRVRRAARGLGGRSAALTR